MDYDNGFFEGLNNKSFDINNGDDQDYRQGYIDGQKKRISDKFEEVINLLIGQKYLSKHYEGNYNPELHFEGLLEKYLIKIKNKMNEMKLYLK